MAKSLFPEFDADDSSNARRSDRRRANGSSASNGNDDPARTPRRPGSAETPSDADTPAPCPMPGVARGLPEPPRPRPGEQSLPGFDVDLPAEAASPPSDSPPSDSLQLAIASGDTTASAPFTLASEDLAAMFTGEGDNAVESDDDLIPARMLNEFTYCPRLAWLEWVQGEFEDNLETREGSFAHRRVDKPTQTSFTLREQSETTADGVDSAGAEESRSSPEGDEAPLSADRLAARALMLSAHKEGLVAKLDLVELEGRHAVPVDYKRGSVPDNAWQSWEPERVQLCAQGLILRANGYECDHGLLYYVESKRRIRVEFDDTLIARTRALVTEMRALATGSAIPPPLMDSPKCPRCSLVGICLPDETRLLAELQAHVTPTAVPAAESDHATRPPDQEVRVRNLLPSRNDALPLYVQQQGATLSKDGERLIIKPRDGKPVVAPFIEVSQVSLFGNVQVSTPLLRELATRGVPVCHFSQGGWFQAITTGHVHRNIDLRIRQFRAADDEPASLRIARPMIAAKIRNSRTLLRRHSDDGFRDELRQLAEWAKNAERADSRATLLGIEGMAAKVYFGGFARLFKRGDAFRLEGRNRRPPTDPVNALLSFVYAILTKELTIACQSVGFDPHLGFLHRPRYGRPSLALDLAEEFRPLVADSVVLTLINNEEVSPKSFVSRAGSVALTETGRKAALAAFERRLETEITHPVFGYRITYRRVFEVQARLLSRVLLRELTDYPGFTTR
jgi:CRISPR-associated protein Cas1